MGFWGTSSYNYAKEALRNNIGNSDSPNHNTSHHQNGVFIHVRVPFLGVAYASYYVKLFVMVV